MALTLFGQATAGMPGLASDPTSYTMGVQFSVSASGYQLDGIWFWSPATAGVLPQTIALYAVSGTSLVTSQAASWTASPGGSAASAGSGWCFAAFTSPPSLTSGVGYKACVLQNTAASWYGATASYWVTGGAGAGGITNGALSAPNSATAGGQDSFNASATLTYPASSFNDSNYWVDPQVSLPSSGGTAVAYSMRRFP